MERFGLFGVRLATTLIRQGMTDPTAIAAELVKRSGLDELRSVLTTQFSERRDLLKARSALLAVDLVLDPRAAPGHRRRWRREVERILAGAHEFAELRLLSTLRAGAIKLPTEVLAGGRAAARRRRRRGRGPARARTRRRARRSCGPPRWTRWAAGSGGRESPMSGRAVADVARLVVRSCEGILAAMRQA